MESSGRIVSSSKPLLPTDRFLKLTVMVQFSGSQTVVRGVPQVVFRGFMTRQGGITHGGRVSAKATQGHQTSLREQRLSNCSNRSLDSMNSSPNFFNQRTTIGKSGRRFLRNTGKVR